MSQFQKEGDPHIALFNCDYLPSRHGDIPCFYKPVTCGSPPEVDNSTVILNNTQRDVYQLHDVIQYSCVNETFQMEGNGSITCQYSGQWSAPPICVTIKKRSLNIVNIILGGSVIVLFFSTVLVIIYKKRTPAPVVKYERILRDQVLDDYTENDQPLSRIRRKHENKRNRQFDAFVAYYFDSDNDFVVDKLLPELEETRKFRLCFHSRDFNIGYDIKDNIQEAVESSNSAIILMSQGFVNSNWCREEFNDCYRGKHEG